MCYNSKGYEQAPLSKKILLAMLMANLIKPTLPLRRPQLPASPSSCSSNGRVCCAGSMASSLPAAFLLLLASAHPAASFTWTLGPPPPLPPLPGAALATARPRPQALPIKITTPGWEVVAQAQKPRWEIVPRPAPTPAASVTLASANPLWERVPTHERILHSQVLAIVATPDPIELVQLDRPALRWESVPAPQPTYAAYGSTESSAVRPVLGRRVWFRF